MPLVAGLNQHRLQRLPLVDAAHGPRNRSPDRTPGNGVFLGLARERCAVVYDALAARTAGDECVRIDGLYVFVRRNKDHTVSRFLVPSSWTATMATIEPDRLGWGTVGHMPRGMGVWEGQHENSFFGARRRCACLNGELGK